MKVSFQEFSVSTTRRVEVVDITRRVEDITQGSGVKHGLCLVHTPHSTAAIIVNEHESGLMQDVVSKVEGMFPRGAGYLHDRVDDNANAHLVSVFIGSSKVFPVRNSGVVRGTWQNIFFLEVDGPRSRRVMVEVLGE